MEMGRLRLWRAPIHGLAVGLRTLLLPPGQGGPALAEAPDSKRISSRIETIRFGGRMLRR
jgi:hypothetical protein